MRARCSLCLQPVEFGREGMPHPHHAYPGQTPLCPGAGPADVIVKRTTVEADGAYRYDVLINDQPVWTRRVRRHGKRGVRLFVRTSRQQDRVAARLAAVARQ